MLKATTQARQAFQNFSDGKIDKWAMYGKILISWMQVKLRFARFAQSVVSTASRLVLSKCAGVTGWE